MRRRVCLGLFCMLGLISIYFFYRGVQSLEVLGKAGEKVSIVLENEIKASEAREILQKEKKQEEPLYPVFWTESGKQQIQSKTSQKSVSLKVVQTEGNTGLLIPGGNSLAADDREGCLIDEHSAAKLFGYGEAAGEILLYNNNRYTIRGVLKGLRSTMVIQAPITEDASILLDTVTAKNSSMRRDEIIQTLAGRYNIQGTPEEWNLLYGLTKGILLLLPLAAAVAVMGRIYANIGEAREKKEKIFWKICFYVSVAAVLLGMLGQISLPSDMVPSVWSDFDFWANLWDEKKEALSFLMDMAKRGPEIPYMNAFFKAASYGILSLTLYFLSIICYTQKGGKSLNQ